MFSRSFNSVVTLLQNRFSIYCALLILTSAISRAQVTQIGRYEKEMKNSDEEFMVLSMKEYGLSLFRQKDKFNNGNRLWELSLLDTALTETWNAELEISNRLNLIGHDFANGNLYYLFRYGDGNDGELTLYKINPVEREITTHVIKQELNFRTTHFSMLQNHALLGGYINKDPLVTLYDLKEKSNKIVPGFFQSNTEMLDLRPNVNNTFNALLVERASKEKRKLILKTFDTAGSLLMDDEIELPSDKYIVSAMTTTLLRDEMLILGTWTSANGVRQATGFFSIVVDPFTNQTPTYYDFAQLNHFLDYMKPKRAAKIKSKSQARREMSRVPEFKAFVNPIRIEETSEGFVLLSEVYQSNSNPSSNYRGPGYYNMYGMTYPYYGYPYRYTPTSSRYPYPSYSNTPFNQPDDSRVLHSSVSVFDATGKLIADQGMKLNEVKLTTLEQVSDFWFTPNKSVILYKKEKLLREGIFELDGKVIQQDTVENKLNEGEIIRSEENENTGVRHWYGSYFYMWGNQTIQDTRKKWEDRNRYVFYIQKYKAE